MMNIKLSDSIEKINLAEDEDYLHFAKLISYKISEGDSAFQYILFINELLSDMYNKMEKEDYQDIQQKLMVLINRKIKDEKGKEKKKKKGGIQVS